jgi:hypothetical protein
MAKDKNHSAEVHTPDELLAGARRLLALADPVTRRAAVLEAITALEAFVQHRVFAALNDKLDPLLVRWLEEKTKMDFDSRLGILTPIATGLPVSEQASLWTRYKAAKRLRNFVTHSGRQVSQQEAEEALLTVHDWLAYLASSAEVDTALAAFKRAVESGQIFVSDSASASKAIANFFNETTPAKAAFEEPIGGGCQADVVLRFGERLVVIEHKFLNVVRRSEMLVAGIRQLESLMSLANAHRGALVVFSKDELPINESQFKSLGDGKLSVVQIQLPQRN